MIYACETSKEPGMQGVCGLLGKETVSGSDSEGFILSLRGIVERFQVTWAVTPLHESHSGESVEIGFVLELNGTHEPVADHVGRTCRHCANLMLALKIIGDWLLPPQGKCSFCEVQAYSDFVRAEQKYQAEACSTRALRLVSHLGTLCQLGACHVWCMTKMKARLNRIGAVERGRNSLSAERAGL
jgi:hypothetical protein